MGKIKVEKFTISRNDSFMEGWPDMIKLKSGRILVVYNECTSHINRNGTHIAMRMSDDNGKTWSEKQYIGEETAQSDHWNSIRVNQLKSGKIILVCDRVIGTETSQETKFYTFESNDDGVTWSDKYDINVFGYCSDKIRELSDSSLLLCVSRNNPNTSRSEILAHKSYDGGKSWTPAQMVATDDAHTFIEPAAIELENGTVAVLIRENSLRGNNGYISFSDDKGKSFFGLREIAVRGMHRPFINKLSNGKLLLSYREHLMAGQLYPDLRMCALGENDLLDKNKAPIETELVDHDQSQSADQGYSAWVELDDGMILMANYIVDDAPKAYIRGYRIKLEEDYA